MLISEQVDHLARWDLTQSTISWPPVLLHVSFPSNNAISFMIGMATSILLADLRYGISPNAIVDSAAKYLESFDVGVMCAKGFAFGSAGHHKLWLGPDNHWKSKKGVGESTTASVVISLVAIFVVDFFPFHVLFQEVARV